MCLFRSVHCAAPVFSQARPQNAAASSSATVTISGLNFGKHNFTPSVGLVRGSELCETVSWTTGTTVKCLLASPSVLASSAFPVMTVAAVVGTRAALYQNQYSFDGGRPLRIYLQHLHLRDRQNRHVLAACCAEDSADLQRL